MRRSTQPKPKIPRGLASNLRRIRAEQNLSTIDLADRAHLSATVVASIEAGAEPVLETLWALAFGLDVAFVELVSDAQKRAEESLFLEPVLRHPSRQGSGAGRN